MTDEFKKELEELKKTGEAPEWYSEASYITVSKGYRLKGETPRKMYKRVAKSVAHNLGKEELEDAFFKAIWDNWLCPASPVLSNSGTDRGFPISCFGINVSDSVRSITEGISEMATLSKNSGGVGVNFTEIRPRGTPIKGGANGSSQGIIPFAKMYDSTILGISQNVRRGAASVNLDIEHGDWEEFARMRRPEGDINFQCGNLHHCAVVKDSFMQKVVDGDSDARKRWTELMRSRMETGEPYIMYKDTANRMNPPAYKNMNFSNNFTNICSEIVLHADQDHSFICCLSSLNLAKYDEWKDAEIEGMSLPYLSILFLNGVLNEFISKAEHKWGLEKTVRSARKGRAVGLGVLGWHTLLQSKMLPFDSFESMRLNAEIFRNMKEQALKASQDLAKEDGEPAWCENTGMRNSHLLAIAPTRSNSIISGDVSAGIEPNIANVFVDKSAKGTFVKRNGHLEEVLEKYGKNDEKTWKNIARDYGSVQGLSFLSENEKKVFLTAYEIDQMAIIRQASQRQQWVCQSQSVNLFFSTEVDPKFFNKVHLEAWKMGLKTLYYCRSRSGIRADVASRDEGECSSCEG